MTPDQYTMTPDQYTILSAHAQGLRAAIDARHRDALAAYTMEVEAHDRYATALLQGAPEAPALFPPDADPRPWPDERHLYPGGSIETMRGAGRRPRRWRGDEVEYLYKTGGNLRIMVALGIGTMDGHGRRWVTARELVRCASCGKRK